MLVLLLAGLSAYLVVQNQSLTSQVSALSGKLDQFSGLPRRQGSPATKNFDLIITMFGESEEEEEAKHRWISSTLFVNKGDTVILKVTNMDHDAVHGFGIAEYNISESIDPGETITIEFVADKEGIFTFYCTRPGCAPDHLEQVGQLVVL